MGGFNIREFINMDNSFVRRQNTRKNSGNSLANQLPPEVLAQIFSCLQSGKDLANVSRVNKAFHEASQIDKVWQTRCWKDFRVKMSANNAPITYMQLYKKVLHKYGALLGLWQTDITNYGGLVQVECIDGKIIGIEWMAPTNPNYMGDLRRQELFTIDVTKDGETRVLCLRGYHGPHKCKIITKDTGNFSSKCCEPDNHRHPHGKDEEFQEWLKEETIDFHHFVDPMSQERLFTKFLNVKQYENSYNFRRLHLPPVHPKAIIQPGIFKGTYGDHGLELILLNYYNDGYDVKATKLLGDPNVPAGKITFRVDLRYSMVLTEAQQGSMSELAKIPRSTSVILPQNLPVQQFRVPVDCMDRGTETPRQCNARFHGFGQVAGHGFTNSSYTSGHWIVFNEDLFGFLWMELGSLGMYHRVKESIG